MAETSKELLDQPPKPSLLDTLLLGGRESKLKTQTSRQQCLGDVDGKPFTTSVHKSQVLGKVKDFLGVMAKANENLELNAQGNSRLNYDIEVLSGNEQEYIEMDLLLGVADLHTAEAVAAAEATVGGFQQSISSASSSSSDSEDDNDEDKDDGNNNITLGHLDKSKKPESDKDNSLHENKPNKRPKIVVLN